MVLNKKDIKGLKDLLSPNLNDAWLIKVDDILEANRNQLAPVRNQFKPHLRQGRIDVEAHKGRLKSAIDVVRLLIAELESEQNKGEKMFG